jgi:hypothetical protein
MTSLKKFNQLTGIPTLVLILLGFTIAYAQEAVIILKWPDGTRSPSRAAVTFPHEEHMDELECLQCHHKYKDGVNILEEDALEEGNTDLLCSACHTDNAKINLKRAFHRECMGCHRKLRLAGKSTGPELCGQCHIKS